MTELDLDVQAAEPCDHYWSWVSPAGASHSARICMTCHVPDADWLNEVYGELEATRAERDHFHLLLSEERDGYTSLRESLLARAERAEALLREVFQCVTDWELGTTLYARTAAALDGLE